MAVTDLFKMLKDANALQKNVKQIKDRLRERSIEFASGDGKVVVTARGDASIVSIKIDPSVIDPAQPEALEKLVMAAVDGALDAAKKMSAEEMKKAAAAMGLPQIPGL